MTYSQPLIFKKIKLVNVAIFFPNRALNIEPDGAARISLPPFAAAPGFEPMSVESHRDPGPLKDALPTELPRCGK